jgi:hypothetical protein
MNDISDQHGIADHRGNSEQLGEADQHSKTASARADALDDLRKHLLRRYARLLIPPAIVLAAVEGARALGYFTSLKYVDHQTWDVVLFVLAAIFAAALPILYRVLFARAHRGKSAVTFSALFRFERNSMGIALYTPWIAVIASLIAVSGYLMSGIFLLAIYAAYVFFPSRRRLSADARIFRVRVQE